VGVDILLSPAKCSSAHAARIGRWCRPAIGGSTIEATHSRPAHAVHKSDVRKTNSRRTLARFRHSVLVCVPYSQVLCTMYHYWNFRPPAFAMLPSREEEEDEECEEEEESSGSDVESSASEDGASTTWTVRVANAAGESLCFVVESRRVREYSLKLTKSREEIRSVACPACRGVAMTAN
jgi:hypothetical protein